MSRLTPAEWAHEKAVRKFLAKHVRPPSKKQRKRMRRKARLYERMKREGWQYKVKRKGNWQARVCGLPSSKFYKTDVWRELRRRVLETYGYKCMSCGSLDSMHVDHIKPRSERPELSITFDNLQVLCSDCNRAKSNHHSDDYREAAVAEELDRQAYLDAASMGL